MGWLSRIQKSDMFWFLENLNGPLWLRRLQIWEDSRFQVTLTSPLLQTQSKASLCPWSMCPTFPQFTQVSVYVQHHELEYVPYYSCWGLNTWVSPRFLCWNLISKMRDSGRFREWDYTALVNVISVYRLRSPSFSHVRTQEKPLSVNQGAEPTRDIKSSNITILEHTGRFLLLINELDLDIFV